MSNFKTLFVTLLFFISSHFIKYSELKSVIKVYHYVLDIGIGLKA